MTMQSSTNVHGCNGNGNGSSAYSSLDIPNWVRADKADWGERLKVSEWQDDGGEYRHNNGWKGCDLVHDKNSPVRVLEYYVRYGPGIAAVPADVVGNSNGNNDNNSNTDETKGEPKPTTIYKTFARGGVGTTLTGIVHFTQRAESHRGYCHGGSMCSIMDDVIGWVGFLATGECIPWSGYTVQVDSKLQKPVRVDSVLMVRATIAGIERRKVSIEAVISDPSENEQAAAIDDGGNEPESEKKHEHSNGKRKRDPSVHATASGLVVVNRGVFCETRQPQTNP
eukprot:CAMPEP_0168181348 /NCGR_PEP_ID=MMETSP0139_2-20121125/11160_1 /TAXON_ID=44445 /ORGANISM="Pseudo-nitzschia australis, Strain 10249 10 AB" /LENGTH=280 /DNA_ID=CAMNT_0008101901 /DNA_START=37 /DNA_END=879 /DNA_ORIENTATION=-